LWAKSHPHLSVALLLKTKIDLRALGFYKDDTLRGFKPEYAEAY